MEKWNKGVFVYPWTLSEQDPRIAVKELKEKTGIDHILVCSSYHSGRFYQPLSENKMYTRHSSGLSFLPNNSLYPEELRPAVDDGVKDSSLHKRIQEACDEQDISYVSWVVGLHQSSLGKEHQDLAVQNAFGDIYDYALCPANPIVKKYLQALVEDVCQQFDPETIMIETPGYLGFVHGHHHELILSELGEVGKYLLSLCFCPSCHKVANQVGIDSEKVQVRTRELVKYLTEKERGALPAEFTEAELASILLEEPEIYSYTRMRMNIVTSLVKEIANQVHKIGKKILIVPSVFTRPVSKAWMEGTELKEMSAHIDGFMLLSYFSDPDWVRGDVEWLKMFIGESTFNSAFNAGAPDAKSEESLHACSHEALKLGAAGLSFYNASLLSDRRLNWIAHFERD